jgi:hypothetical protein
MSAGRRRGRAHGRGRSAWMPPCETQLEATLAISCGIAITPRMGATLIETTMSRTSTMLGKVELFQQKQGN